MDRENIYYISDRSPNCEAQDKILDDYGYTVKVKKFYTTSQEGMKLVEKYNLKWFPCFILRNDKIIDGPIGGPQLKDKLDYRKYQVHSDNTEEFVITASNRFKIYIVYSNACKICQTTIPFIKELQAENKLTTNIEFFEIRTQIGQELVERYNLEFFPTIIYPDGKIKSDGLRYIVFDKNAKKNIKDLLNKVR